MTAKTYANLLTKANRDARKAYDQHDINLYLSLKKSGELLYAAIVAQGFTISYDEERDAYSVK